MNFQTVFINCQPQYPVTNVNTAKQVKWNLNSRLRKSSVSSIITSNFLIKTTFLRLQSRFFTKKLYARYRVNNSCHVFGRNFQSREIFKFNIRTWKNWSILAVGALTEGVIHVIHCKDTKTMTTGMMASLCCLHQVSYCLWSGVHILKIGVSISHGDHLMKWNSPVFTSW